MSMQPGSAEWQGKITASKVAAILGVSPWESQRSIWHKMRGEVPAQPSNESQQRGHYLEPAILAWWRDQHPEFDVFEPQPQFTLGNWAAATPDGEAWATGDTGPGPVLVEAKSAAYDDDWGDPGTDVIPAYYLVQCYWSLHVANARFTTANYRLIYVPVLTSRLRFAEYVVEFDPAIGADLEQRMRAFYDSLSTEQPPPLDDSLATFDVIRKLHPDIDRDLIAECTRTEAAAYIDAMNRAKAAADDERAQKSWAFDRMGRARYLTCNGVRIARRQPNKTGISLVQVAKDTELIDLAEMESAIS